MRATASGVTCIRVYTYIIAHTFSFLFCGREKPCLSSVTAGQEKETERLRRAGQRRRRVESERVTK